MLKIIQVKSLIHPIIMQFLIPILIIKDEEKRQVTAVKQYIIANEKKPSFWNPTLSIALECPFWIELEAMHNMSKAKEQWVAFQKFEWDAPSY